jgi:hypothetical protein
MRLHSVRIARAVLLCLLAAARVGAAATADGGPTITAGYANQSIASILSDLSAIAGTDIEFNGDLSVLKKQVTVVVEDETLGDAIKKALAGMSFLLVDHSSDYLSITFIGNGSDGNHLFRPDGKTGMGEWSAALDELKAIQASGYQHRELSPDEVEVVPPLRDGQRGVTLAEFRLMEAQSVPLQPSDIQVVPPTQNAANGTSLQQFEILQSQRSEMAGESVQVVPLVGDATQGIIAAEFEKMQESRVPMSPDIIEMIPPQ